jgi:hypothetical protein
VDKGLGWLESQEYWTITDVEYIHYLNADNTWSKLTVSGWPKVSGGLATR